jgi:type III secretory pathway component EscV
VSFFAEFLVNLAVLPLFILFEAFFQLNKSSFSTRQVELQHSTGAILAKYFAKKSPERGNDRGFQKRLSLKYE